MKHNIYSPLVDNYKEAGNARSTFPQVEKAIGTDHDFKLSSEIKKAVDQSVINASVQIAGALETRRKWYANPKFALTIGVLEISLLIYTLAHFKIIEGDFFRFGPPIQLFQYNITSNSEFFGITLVIFIHQMVFTWLNEVTSPWVVNEVQDPTNRFLTFSKSQTLVLINIYYIYFTLNSVFVVNVSLSQLSFLCVMILADFLATTSLNLHYVWNKQKALSPDELTKMESGLLSGSIKHC